MSETGQLSETVALEQATPARPHLERSTRGSEPAEKEDGEQEARGAHLAAPVPPVTRARTGLPAGPAGSGHTGRQLVLLKEGTGRAGAGYQTASGTSMAAPYAAGIAALLAEANPTARGAALQGLVLQSFLALVAPARDVGAGLVQAPQ